jgi:UDP-N-acetylmuramate dehydrogenase
MTVLGCGSNVLAPDAGVRSIVIKTTKACLDLSVEGGRVIAGASVSLSHFVSFCVRHGYYGMEYLHSIPATVGGAICMNAGRGRQYHCAISDYLRRVWVCEGGRIVTRWAHECAFDYRRSRFLAEPHTVVIRGEFELPRQDPALGSVRIRERVEFIKRTQDRSCPNAGTVFKAHFRPLPELAGLQIGGARFSATTPNWIVNVGAATADDVTRLVSFAVALHEARVCRRPELEIVLL